MAQVGNDYVQTLNRPLDAVNMDELRGVFATQTADGTALIQSENVALTGIKTIHSLDMQFVGQTHLIRVPLASLDISQPDLRALFERVYFNRFRVDLAEIKANVVNVNTPVIGQRAPVDLGTLIDPSGRKSTLAEAKRATRAVYFDTWHDTPIYQRDLLPIDAEIHGPAIVEQMDTTILLEPGDIARSDPGGNLLVKIGNTA